MLRHLHHACCRIREFCDAFGASGAVEQLLSLAADFGRPEGVRQYAVLAVTALCEHSAENRRVRCACSAFPFVCLLATTGLCGHSAGG